MSVLFLPPPSASAIPDASETVSGKIRIATSAEATAGTNDLTAMTPAKVKSVVDAAVVGGVEYKGTFDAAAPADLSNAEQGDLYIISGAGTYQGQAWAVGDHLLINTDMGGTLDPAKIDKVDNTDAVTSVAGRTGAVTLSTADISGLATVASTGAYSDLTGTPTLATVATTGAYSDLSGTPSLATVATTGAYSDLTGTPSLATVATTGAYSDLSGTPTLGTAAAEDVGTSAGNVVQLDGSARLPAVDGSQLTNLPSGATTLGALTDVDVVGVVNTNVLKYNSTSGDWEDGAVAASEVSGLATVATTGAYSDLSGTPTLATVATTGAYSDLSGTPTNVSTFTNDAGYLTGITGESLNDLSDVSFSAGPGIDNYVLTYDNATSSWGAEAAAGGGTAPTVSVSSPSTDQTLSSPSAGVIEEVYVYTPSVDISVNLVAAATCGAGFKYQIKNMSTNVITIDPDSTETVDGSSTFLLNAQYESATLITDGSNWFVI